MVLMGHEFSTEISIEISVQTRTGPKRFANGNSILFLSVEACSAAPFDSFAPFGTETAKARSFPPYSQTPVSFPFLRVTQCAFFLRLRHSLRGHGVAISIDGRSRFADRAPCAGVGGCRILKKRRR
jgi:hypothetical protein